MRAGTQGDVVIPPHKAQQIPDLLLAAIGVTPLPLDPVARHAVLQPATRTAEDLDVLRTQPHFLVELPEHRLLGGFAVLYAALRKLPSMLAYPLSPEHLIARIDQNDADVRAIAFTIEHGRIHELVV